MAAAEAGAEEESEDTTGGEVTELERLFTLAWNGLRDLALTYGARDDEHERIRERVGSAQECLLGLRARITSLEPQLAASGERECKAFEAIQNLLMICRRASRTLERNLTSDAREQAIEQLSHATRLAEVIGVKASPLRSDSVSCATLSPEKEG